MDFMSVPADGSPNRFSDVLDPVSNGVTPGAGRPAHRGPNPGGAAAYDGACAFKCKYFHRVRLLIIKGEAPLAMPEMPAPMPTKVPLTPLTMLEPTLAMVWSRQPYSTQSGAGARTRG